MRTWALSLVFFVAIIAIAYVFSIGTDVSTTIGTYPDRTSVSVETYVRQHISELSPVKEVLGGKYFVTDIVVGDGRGTVAYEDGHNAYVADFTYSMYSDIGISIDSFVIR